MRLVHAALFLFAAVASGQPAPDSVVVGYMRDLAMRAALKADNFEVAAFIVADGAGDVTCRMWPGTATRASEHYDGVIPDGTIAIAHSHPYTIPLASGADVALAKRLALPVYVVSRWELHVVEPSSGKDTLLLRGAGWTRRDRLACTETASLR